MIPTFNAPHAAIPITEGKAPSLHTRVSISKCPRCRWKRRHINLVTHVRRTDALEESVLWATKAVTT